MSTATIEAPPVRSTDVLTVRLTPIDMADLERRAAKLLTEKLDGVTLLEQHARILMSYLDAASEQVKRHASKRDLAMYELAQRYRNVYGAQRLITNAAGVSRWWLDRLTADSFGRKELRDAQALTDEQLCRMLAEDAEKASKGEAMGKAVREKRVQLVVAMREARPQWSKKQIEDAVRLDRTGIKRALTAAGCTDLLADADAPARTPPSQPSAAVAWTREQKDVILRMAEQGYKPKEIAATVAVSYGTVCKIVKSGN